MTMADREFQERLLKELHRIGDALERLAGAEESKKEAKLKHSLGCAEII